MSGAKSILLFAIFISLVAGAAQARYSGGTGEPNDPYRIATPEDLNDIGRYEEDWDKHFILVNDVNLAEYTGEQFKIIGRWIWWDDPGNKPFTGVFDGNDHTVWNFTWTSDGRNGIGLFGYVGSSGQIKNLVLQNVNVNTGGWYVSGLVGWNEGSITNCYSSGSILGIHSIGALAGKNSEGGIICACYSTGSVSGESYIGGLAGQNRGWITNCYSSGNVPGEDDYVGGLTGSNSGTITNCYSSGSVSAMHDVGGLVGEDEAGTGNVINSFWDIETSGQLTSAGGTPKTTAEMKTMSTFTDAGWDFVEIWGIGEHQTYPYLRTEPAGDSNHDKKVNFEDLAILASHWLSAMGCLTAEGM